MALFFKVVTICIIGWVTVQGVNAGDQSENQSWSSFPLELPPLLSQLFNQIWMPRLPTPPTPPTPVQLPEWMTAGGFPTLPTAPVAPTPVQLPEWMTSGKFPTPTPVKLPDWMNTGELPNMPNQPDLTSASVVNTKPGDHLQYNGVAVRSSNDGVNSGTSMATNDNGKVKLAKDGSAPPALNKPLPSMDPNARFSSFASSSFSSSNTVDGKTVTVGSSDTKVNNDGKVDAESVHVVQADKAYGWKDAKEESDIEDVGSHQFVTIEDDDSDFNDDDEESLPKSESQSSSSSSSSSSSTSSSSSKNGDKPKFTSSSKSSFSSSSDVNGVKDKLSGSSVVVNDNGKVLAKKNVNREKRNDSKKESNYIGSKDNKKVIPLAKAEDDCDDEESSPKSHSKTASSSSSSSSSSTSSSSSEDGDKPKFTSSSMSSFSSSSDVNGVKDKLSGSSIIVNDNGKVVAKKAVNREKYDS